VSRRLAKFLDRLEETRPDVVRLQELKSAERDLPRAAIEAAG